MLEAVGGVRLHYRTLEVDQAFALSQVDAQALIDLRETGECTFTASEVFFDLFYPGHYKRRIKAVRLTIPRRRAQLQVLDAGDLDLGRHRP